VILALVRRVQVGVAKVANAEITEVLDDLVDVAIAPVGILRVDIHPKRVDEVGGPHGFGPVCGGAAGGEDRENRTSQLHSDSFHGQLLIV
jgi:hypothetical protein